jgi:2-amino-4-hydroxy-6-hydroxymethyldihydropteridine diphosphokinase
VHAGIALGSNLGDRAGNLRAAVRSLREISDPQSPLLWSSIYETAPVGCDPGTTRFFNAVVEIGYTRTLMDFLVDLRQIEENLGRPQRRPKNEPRTIDLDILYFGEATSDEPTLIVPHPRLAQRRFVLLPLSEIRPELVIPGQSLTITKLLANLGEAGEVLRTKELLTPF